MIQPLEALRVELKKRDLDGFIVPHADIYGNEFLPPSAEQLAWLSGFTGSAGLAVVLADQAALFIDGRYQLQARDEVDHALFSFHHLVTQSPSSWVAEALPPGGRLGYDWWVHTSSEVAIWREACAAAGGELVGLENNPLEAVWQERPPLLCGPIQPHDLDYSGQELSQKIATVAADLQQVGCRACVLTRPDSIAWLFNIRGSDTPYTPLPLVFAVVLDQPDLPGPEYQAFVFFTDPDQVSPELNTHLDPVAALRPLDDLSGMLKIWGRKGHKIWIDPARTPHAISETLSQAGGQTYYADDPCLLPKACKNAVEIAGARSAHQRDGAALCRFFYWLENSGLDNGVDELTAAAKLQDIRAADSLFRSPSFETISASQAHGAIVHYRVTPHSNQILRPGDLYLLDSGGQYLDGTTDVTRTVFIAGPDHRPEKDHRTHFTTVLKGHIALSLTRFPEGMDGARLDPLARAPLWRLGLDYDHGTGHGVGSYLSVHEGPQRIAKTGGHTPLQPGMILSNEPGYYREGHYGIRIENLLCVRGPDDGLGARAEQMPGSMTSGATDERVMLSFEVLTLVPMDRRLIDLSLLNSEEHSWIDTYHRRVKEELTPLLDQTTTTWLHQATRPLAEDI